MSRALYRNHILEGVGLRMPGLRSGCVATDFTNLLLELLGAVESVCLLLKS